MADISRSIGQTASRYPRAETQTGASIAPTRVPLAAWRALAERAVEPNAYQLPEWAQAIAASGHGGRGARALAAWRGTGAQAGLLGIIPVMSMWRAYRLPLPALVNVDPLTSLGTPLLDRDDGVAAVTGLLRDARQTGARALVLRHVTTDGPMMQMLREALAKEGLAPLVLQGHKRACLDATRDADDVLREALGSKKLKELRRLRKRLAAHGEVAFEIARTPEAVASSLPGFLALESSGWKGARGTALNQHAGDLAFIRSATSALATQAQCEIVTLRAGDTPVASGIVLRHRERAFFFKIGVDPAFARYSVGVQLTLELTRQLCADTAIRSADSTAAPGHPMIDPIWRGRLAIGDVLIPLRRHDPMVAVIRLALFARRTARSLVKRARAGKSR